VNELELESAGRQFPSCAAQWAVGDALLEECDLDPVWDMDYDKQTFKGGTRLRAAGDFLFEHGLKYSDWELLEFRETSRIFPLDARRHNITYTLHFVATALPTDEAARADVAKDSAMLKPGEVLGLMTEDCEALIKYGPGC
jgi:hypothetical protein